MYFAVFVFFQVTNRNDCSDEWFSSNHSHSSFLLEITIFVRFLLAETCGIVISSLQRSQPFFNLCQLQRSPIAINGVSSPALTALSTLLAAFEASSALLIVGMENVTASLGGGAIRSIQSRKATELPFQRLGNGCLR
jgi:hypothetical protein